MQIEYRLPEPQVKAESRKHHVLHLCEDPDAYAAELAEGLTGDRVKRPAIAVTCERELVARTRAAFIKLGEFAAKGELEYEPVGDGAWRVRVEG